MPQYATVPDAVAMHAS
jgi:hypothetical protein